MLQRPINYATPSDIYHGMLREGAEGEGKWGEGGREERGERDRKRMRGEGEKGEGERKGRTPTPALVMCKLIGSTSERAHTAAALVLATAARDKASPVTILTSRFCHVSWQTWSESKTLLPHDHILEGGREGDITTLWQHIRIEGETFSPHDNIHAGKREAVPPLDNIQGTREKAIATLWQYQREGSFKGSWLHSRIRMATVAMRWHWLALEAPRPCLLFGALNAAEAL